MWNTLSLASSLLALGPQADLPAFGVAPLDPGGTTTLPVALDVASSTQLVGSATPAGAPFAQPAAFTAAGPQILPPLTGDDAGELLAVGLDGVAVGVSFEVVPMGQFLFIFERAARWSGGVPVALDDLVTGGADLELQRAVDLDASGRILGVGRDASIPAGRSFLLEGGIVTDLGILPGAAPSAALRAAALNPAGVVVGTGDGPSGFDHAFRWEAGQVVDLHVLGGVVGPVSSARDLAPDGTVVGGADFSDDGFDFEEPVLWTPGGELVRLGTFGGVQGFARGINAAGDVVGTAGDASGAARAFLWRSGVLVDLNDLVDASLGWTLLDASAIADDGTVVGVGTRAGVLQGFRLDPTPCAGGFALVGEACGGPLGIAGFGCPSPGGRFEVVVQGAPPASPGVGLFGLGTAPLPLAADCVLNVLPLLAIQLPIVSDATGAVALEIELGPAAPSVDVTLQPVLLGPSGALAAPPALVVSIP